MRARPKVSHSWPPRNSGVWSLIEEISANTVPTSSQARAESRKTITGHLVEASISLSSARDTASGGVPGLSEAARVESEAMDKGSGFKVSAV